MAITISYEQSERVRLRADPEYRDAMLDEAFNLIRSNELDVAGAVLRTIVQATIGLEQLGAELGLSARDLARVFGRRGRPQAPELLATHAVLKRLVRQEC